MEPAVDKLEALFQKAESDLNYISLKLESEFSQQFSESGQDELNPIKLLGRINQVKKRFKHLSEEATCTYSRQQEIKVALRNQLLSCCDLLRGSQEQAGLTVLERGADEEEILTKTGTPISQQIPTENEEKENKDVLKARNTQQSGASVQPACRGPRELLPVTETEFLTVSDLVRGRVKLDDVNKVYEVLYNHFKKNESSTHLTPQQMTKMGLKVSGATGEAKLKVLRALKIIVISNKGAVKMAS